MSPSQTLAPNLIRQFIHVVEKLDAAGAGGRDALTSVTETALVLIPAVEYASISLGRHGQFWTVAATDGSARAADDFQYALGTGPCIDAAVDSTVYRTGDLPSDPRWPHFGPGVYEETGALSMLAFRLFIECDTDLIAALNLYSNQHEAFDDADEVSGMLLAARGAAALSQSMAQDKYDALQRTLMSLATVRDATRVLGDTYHITSEQAFAILQTISQYTHQDLAEVAARAADTGALPLSGESAHAYPRASPRS